mgnify:CR=1 FL=1
MAGVVAEAAIFTEGDQEQWRDIVAGSEGVLGIITSATVKLHRVPEVKDYRAYIFMDFGQAVGAEDNQ